MSVGSGGRPLILVGASGLAREVLAVVRSTGGPGVVGVVDDVPAAGDLDGVPVLGGLDALAGRPDADILVCVGHGAARAALVERLRGLGARRYATVVHPGATVPASCTVGPGSILLDGWCSRPPCRSARTWC